MRFSHNIYCMQSQGLVKDAKSFQNLGIRLVGKSEKLESFEGSLDPIYFIFRKKTDRKKTDATYDSGIE